MQTDQSKRNSLIDHVLIYMFVCLFKALLGLNLSPDRVLTEEILDTTIEEIIGQLELMIESIVLTISRTYNTLLNPSVRFDLVYF